jgi:hypothetical protein
MQRAQSDDEFRHADLSSNPLILDRPDRCNRRIVHAPKRGHQALSRNALSVKSSQPGTSAFSRPFVSFAGAGAAARLPTTETMRR